MGEAGETELVEVGRTLLGATGALVIGAAGLLATLSSANASILSSSRAVFALSRDGILPDRASRVSRRFRTPHVATLMAGVPIALLTLLGRIEVLAEVASILHLVMYGLICLAALVLGRGGSLWYRPTFRTPGGRLVQVVGAAACFGLLAFMGPPALLASGAVLLAAGAWYLLYARRRGIDVRGVEELAPAPEVARASLLVQMELPDPPRLPEALIRALAPDDVLLLGWVQVPEQSSAEQVQEKLGEEAEEELREVARRLEELEMSVETELVFTGDLVRTIDRISADREVDAVLSLRPVSGLEEILVALDDTDQAPQAAGYAARIGRAADARVRVIAPGGSEELGDALRRHFLDAGVRPRRLEVTAGTGSEGSSEERILEQVGKASLIVIGLDEPAADDETYGGLPEKITRHAEVPVLIVHG